jgi:predicted phage terminase large subunit-like protein
MTFKDTKGTDLVVGQVWLRRGADAFLLDQVRGRWDFVETCRQFRQFSAKWPQAVMKLVEDKANGPAVIAQLQHIVPGIIPEEPDGSKTARAAAATPLHEAGNLWLPAPELEAEETERPYAWVGDYIEEHAQFPFGAHDDQVDGTSQALKRLVLIPLWEGGIVTESDLDEELDSFSIAPYAL